MTWTLLIPMDPTITLEVIVGLGGFIWYILNRRARDHRLKFRLASTLLRELEDNNLRLWPALENNDVGDIRLPLPCQVYDGLISSTNISYFDTKTQLELYKIYFVAKSANTGKITPPYSHQKFTGMDNQMETVEFLAGWIEDAIRVVKQFRDCHRYGGRWRAVLKAVHWAYDR